MMAFPRGTHALRLQIVLIIFLSLATLSLCIMYIADPSLYTQSFALVSSPPDRYPLPVTLFLVGVVIFIALLIFGVLRRWRWLFWLLLIAFSCSLLQIPAILLQIVDILPGSDPLWYSLLRVAVALVEVGIAVWMIQIYRCQGTWAIGKGKSRR